jgi:hypothetical protein
MDRSVYTYPALVVFAFFFMFLRTVLETISTGLFFNTDKILVAMVCIQYLLWYLSTFLMILACFRYVGGFKLRQLPYLLLSSVILLIPVIAAGLAHEPSGFIYLSYRDPDVWKSIASLMYLNHANHYMFYELLALVVGVFAITYAYSRDAARSLWTTVSVYGALIFIQAFLPVCSVERCIFVADSDIPISIFLCFYSAVPVAGWLYALFYPELQEYLRSEESIFTQTTFANALLLFIPYGVVALLMSGYLVDLFFLASTYFLCFYACLFLYRHGKDPRLLVLNVFLGIWAALMLTAFFLTCWRFFVG